jgi:Trp operon repressor
MTRLPKTKSDEYTQDLIHILYTYAHNEIVLKEFLKDLLTPKEYRDIGIRWQIIKRLVDHEKHRDIARELKIGVGTVTRGSRELSDKNGGFWQIVKKLRKTT